MRSSQISLHRQRSPRLPIPRFQLIHQYHCLLLICPHQTLAPCQHFHWNHQPRGAGFTQIAPTVASGATQATGDSCSNNVFEGDVTIPDGSVLDPGYDFQKIWKIRNTGTCLWDEGYKLVYIGGSSPDDLDPYTFEFKKPSDFVASGEAVNIGINLTTPCTPGKYEGHWRMQNDQGYYFGTILSVYVEVKDKCK